MANLLDGVRVVASAVLLNGDTKAAVDWGDAAERRVVADVIATKTLAECLHVAAEHAFARAAAHQSIDEVADDPHVERRNVFGEGIHPVAGSISCIGSAAIVDGEPFAVRRQAPSLGDHTDKIFRGPEHPE